MDKTGIARGIAQRMTSADGLDGVFLGGSLGRGTADAFSDVDIVALADPEAHDAIVDLWRHGIAERAPIVFEQGFRRGSGTLRNAITQDWLRLDLHIVPRAMFTGRARSTVAPLFDPHGIHADLPEDLPPSRPNPDRVRALIGEFFRMMGLMSVGLGRDERITLVTGVELLRNLVRDLYLEQSPVADKGGVLHLSTLITPEQRATLEALPCPGPDRAALIDAHLRIAEVFLPEARRLATELSLDWPQAFEDATRAHISRSIGVDMPG